MTNRWECPNCSHHWISLPKKDVITVMPLYPAAVIWPLVLDTYRPRLYDQIANYCTEKFVYAHSDLAASTTLGINSKEGHGTSHCNIITKKNLTFFFSFNKVVIKGCTLLFWQCSYILQCAKYICTSCTSLSKQEVAKNIQWCLSVLHGECPLCLAVITDTGIERA